MNKLAPQNLPPQVVESVSHHERWSRPVPFVHAYPLALLTTPREALFLWKIDNIARNFYHANRGQGCIALPNFKMFIPRSSESSRVEANDYHAPPDHRNNRCRNFPFTLVAAGRPGHC